MSNTAAPARPPVCWMCEKPIAGRVAFQGNLAVLPVHPECKIVMPARKPVVPTGGGT